MELVGLVVIIYLIYLTRRVNKLENRLGGKQIEAKDTVKQTDAEAEGVHMPTEQNLEPSSQQQVAENDPPGHVGRFFEWVKEDFMMKLGAFLLLLAFAWFVTLAIENGWLGPKGQIALGILAGIAILGLGEWRIKKYLSQGGIFMVLGSTVILLTLLAAREFHGFFTPVTALALSFLSVAYVTLSSLRYKSQNLAFASLILAGLAPLFSSFSGIGVVELFSYLSIVVVGSLWVVYITGWRVLSFAALILVSLYSIPYVSYGGVPSADSMIALMFAFLFTTLFFLTNTASMLVNKGSKIAKEHLYTAFVTGIYLIVWVLTEAPEEWQSMLFVVWALVFSIGASLIFRMTGRPEPFYIYAGTAIALIAAATAVELDGTALTIAYAIEVNVILIAAYLMLSNGGIARSISLLYVVPIVMSLPSFVSRDWRDGVMHSDFAVILIVGLSLLLGAFVLRQFKDTEGEEALEDSRTFSSDLSNVLASISILYGLGLIWLISHAVAENRQTGTTISLVIYTILGIASFIQGALNSMRGLKYGGALLIAFVVGRLLLIDVWDMSTPWRVTTFFVIGILLTATAFFRKKIDASNENQ